MHHCRWRMSHKTKHYQETAKMTNVKGLNVHSCEVISTFNTGRDVFGGDTFVPGQVCAFKSE